MNLGFFSPDSLGFCTFFSQDFKLRLFVMPNFFLFFFLEMIS